MRLWSCWTKSTGAAPPSSWWPTSMGWCPTLTTGSSALKRAASYWIKGESRNEPGKREISRWGRGQKHPGQPPDVHRLHWGAGGLYASHRGGSALFPERRCRYGLHRKPERRGGLCGGRGGWKRGRGPWGDTVRHWECLFGAVYLPRRGAGGPDGAPGQLRLPDGCSPGGQSPSGYLLCQGEGPGVP